MFINSMPNRVQIQSNGAWLELSGSEQGQVWETGNTKVSLQQSDQLLLLLHSPSEAVERVKFRWQIAVSDKLRIVNDHWERGYGDLEWRGLIAERVLPWYFLAYDGKTSYGCGVQTGANAFCFWQVDSNGITLWIDVRSGGRGVQLGTRTLQMATVVTQEAVTEESQLFLFARAFCQRLCPSPKRPSFPVYGGNNWYYAYGESSHSEILKDAELMAELAKNESNRPFMIIDDGWQLCHDEPAYNGGPWSVSNSKFPNMEKLASEMKQAGTRPGIWFRPLLTIEKTPENWILRRGASGEKILDPSVPEVLEKIRSDIKRLTAWGYQLLKHDFSTYDLLGRYGWAMGWEITSSDWEFHDTSRTTAEIILDMYRAIAQAAGDATVLGCNTIGHLSAGIFELQRTGEDTSGKYWERTRLMGVNTLAFTMPKHGTFFDIDADCVGLTDQVLWHYNKQWLDLLSRSGTPLLVSVDHKAAGAEQREALQQAFHHAASKQPVGEPLDWLHTTVPNKWKLMGETVQYDWYRNDGVMYYKKK
ncbi:hypothetical protein [Paenibacillus chungangensis]|uniref:Alpha-galactosidase n=1 Tax=Paenibacillus chungangensis TaxID=696535 RepID=A0ABW3HL63_9BACL